MIEKSENNMPFLDAYLKEWQESFNQLRNRFPPDFDIQKTIREYKQQLIQQITEYHNSRQEELNVLFEQWQGVSEQLQQRFNELSAITQKALIILGEHGWYVDLEGMTDEYLQWLIDNYTKEHGIKAESALTAHFESRLPDIETSIIERFPHRGHLIRAAFSAHRRQEFELSIPVLLAQTDGICKEVINQYFFTKYNKKPCTARYVEQIATDTYTLALLNPLTKTLPINASKNERPETSNELNRHSVLHGEALDYGNKINSLKTISLLNYVVHVLEVTKKP